MTSIEGTIKPGISRQHYFGLIHEYQKKCKSMPGFVYSHCYELDECDQQRSISDSEGFRARVFTVWENEEYQRQNLTSGQLEGTHDTLFPLLTGFPEFSFWLQINGRLLRRTQKHLLSDEELNSWEMKNQIEVSHEGCVIVTCKWRSNSQRILEQSLPYLFEMRKIAMSYNLTQNSQTSNKSTSILCIDYDLYLTQNADDPHQLMEYSIWSGREEFESFMKLPEVLKLRGLVLSILSCEPDISSWKRFSPEFKE